MLHVTTGTVGIANEYHEANEYISPLNGQPVPAPVFVLGEHSFVADDATRFVKLSPQVGECFIAFAEQLGELLRQSMTACAKSGIEPEQALAVFASVLREQLSRLQASASSEAVG